MRTYRRLSIVGAVLWAIGLVLGWLAPGSVDTFAAVAWLGQLLVVVGVAGMAMVWVMRQVIARRLRPPGESDR